MRKIKVALIGTDWNQNEERRKNNQFGGVTYYRLYQPYKFAKEEFDIDFWNANMQKEAEGKKTEQFYNEFVSRYDGQQSLEVPHIFHLTWIHELTFRHFGF